MDKNSNSLNWFEIPVTDLQRARTFYETIFAMQMDEMPEMFGMKMMVFPSDPGNGKVSGALVLGEDYKPVMEGGCTIYLNANPNMDPVLERIEAAGGQILMPKTQIDENIGYMAFFADTEGNRMALHSQE